LVDTGLGLFTVVYFIGLSDLVLLLKIRFAGVKFPQSISFTWRLVGHGRRSRFLALD
jgi:hypothetical protein